MSDRQIFIWIVLLEGIAGGIWMTITSIIPRQGNDSVPYYNLIVTIPFIACFALGIYFLVRYDQSAIVQQLKLNIPFSNIEKKLVLALMLVIPIATFYFTLTSIQRAIIYGSTLPWVKWSFINPLVFFVISLFALICYLLLRKPPS